MVSQTESGTVGQPIRIVGVVLAAGTSDRFVGKNKLLTRIDGEPLVRRAARTLATPAVDRTLAVLGHEADAVREAIAPAVDETLVADGYARGQSASVGAGAHRAAELDADAVVYLPGDMPLVESETVDRLAEVFETARSAAEIVVPEHDGRRGNPVLFTANQFDALASLTGDVGGRALLDRVGFERQPVPDPGIHVDVDTRKDLERIRGGHD